jgi:hypothetical protein
VQISKTNKNVIFSKTKIRKVKQVLSGRGLVLVGGGGYKERV